MPFFMHSYTLIKILSLLSCKKETLQSGGFTFFLDTILSFLYPFQKAASLPIFFSPQGDTCFGIL